MKDRRSFSDYRTDVEKKLKDASYSEDRINTVLSKLDKFNDIKYHFPRKGWKYLIDHFAPEIKRNENVYFTKLDENRSVMCLKTDTNRYTVAFAFKHPKDKYDADYKKYLVYKYVLTRDETNNFQSETDFTKYHVYNGIKASSYKSAIVLANNNCLDSKKVDKLNLALMFTQRDEIKYPYLKDVNEVKAKEYYFTNTYENYKRSREELKDKYELEDKDIRFYFHDYMGILVVRNKDRYHVTFSFINPNDRYHLDNLKNTGDIKHIYKYCLIRNFMSGTYSYAVDSADNSMAAAATMFNMHRYNFPSYYHDTKLDIIIVKR